MPRWRSSSAGSPLPTPATSGAKPETVSVAIHSPASTSKSRASPVAGSTVEATPARNRDASIRSSAASSVRPISSPRPASTSLAAAMIAEKKTSRTRKSTRCCTAESSKRTDAICCTSQAEAAGAQPPMLRTRPLEVVSREPGWPVAATRRGCSAAHAPSGPTWLTGGRRRAGTAGGAFPTHGLSWGDTWGNEWPLGATIRTCPREDKNCLLVS